MSASFCDRCGKYVDMDLDIFGGPSDEGRVVDGLLLCAGCLENYEEMEGLA